MSAAKGATYPVSDLMRDEAETFTPSAFLLPVASYYADAAGNMLSFPFNASTPILHYNRALFRAAVSIPSSRRRHGPSLARRRPGYARRELSAASRLSGRLRRMLVPCRKRPPEK